ncbi:MAG: HEPN domain-containing protein [Clostridiales Family XIII bacterium]|jgi:HEPN domain-containing protein|nr:HEPN domain-containing protein [Clostridiales Family XIII bacterium]
MVEQKNVLLLVAEHDLEAAQLILNMKPELPEMVCYHSVQAVEKCLKAYLAINDHEYPRTHDLGQLSVLCRRYDENLLAIKDDIDRLSRYGQSIKYEDALDLDYAEAKNSFYIAGGLVAFVKQKIDVVEKR